MVVLEAVPLEGELLDHLKNDLRSYRRWVGGCRTWDVTRMCTYKGVVLWQLPLT
jgi:hypothetical protein